MLASLPARNWDKIAWMAQYYLHTAEGRKRKTLYGKTRKEVAKKLANALSDREGGPIFDAESL